MTTFFKYAVEHNGSVEVVNTDFVKSRGCGNPSIVKHNGKYYISMRSTEYTFFNYRKGTSCYNYDIMWYPFNYQYTPANYVSYNYIAEIDLNTYELSNIKEFNPVPITHDKIYNGIEDIRLFVNENNMLCALYSYFEVTATSMNMCVFDDNLNITHVAKYIKENDWQKNWMPLMDYSGRLVRKAFGNIVKSITSDNKLELIDENLVDTNLERFGSTQVLPYHTQFGSEYICMIHDKVAYNTPDGRKTLLYRHAFVLTDRDFNIIRVSEPFSFAMMPIEFTCGMHIENNVLYLPVSLFDSTVFMIKIDMRHVLSFINQEKDLYKNIEFQTGELTDIIKNTDDNNMPLAVSEYIVNKYKDNYCVKLACETLLGASVEDDSTAINWYVEALCDIKKFDIGMTNKYEHMLLGQDKIRDIIDKLRDKLSKY